MPSYEDVTARAGSLQAMTGLTEQEFQALLPPFEQAFVAYMHDHTIDGQPRTVRRYRTYETCPLPTIGDKLLFILTYLKQNPIQEVQGQLFGLSQSNANKWIHLLHTVLNQALAHQELLPARTADDLTELLAAPRTKVAPDPPLFGMMVLSDRSIAPPIPRTSRNSTAARRSATRSKTSW
jgi:Helix-turn-helix of DDE superfamily endonuclease